jgi:hypothetical protein
MKRGREDGQLSKEEYERLDESTSFSQPSEFAVRTCVRLPPSPFGLLIYDEFICREQHLILLVHEE